MGSEAWRRIAGQEHATAKRSRHLLLHRLARDAGAWMGSISHGSSPRGEEPRARIRFILSALPARTPATVFLPSPICISSEARPVPRINAAANPEHVQLLIQPRTARPD